MPPTSPTPWALERAEAYLASRDGRPFGDRTDIALALDAARLDGVRAGLAAAARVCVLRGMDHGCSSEIHLEHERSARTIRAIDPASVVTP